jgi:hypothetical protein
MLLTCFSTVCSEMKSLSPIALFDRPSALKSQHVELALGQIIERLVTFAALADELRLAFTIVL